MRGRAGSPKIGLFQAGSHRIVDTPHCPVHHPAINEAAAGLRRAIRKTGTEPYADGPHRGVLRYVQLVVERATGRVQVVLVGRGTSPDVLGDLPRALEAELGNLLQGLFFNGQPERSNTILGPTTVRLAGEESTRERFGDGVDVFFPPAAFGQNHLPLFEGAVARIGELVPPGAVVAEFYAGVGAIGLGLLRQARAVKFNERSPHGIRGIELGLAAQPPSESAKATVHPGGADECLKMLDGSNVAVVDPPRKGLDRGLRAAIAENPPDRLVYLACGLDSLLEDIAELCRPGGLQIEGIEAFDFFPFTEHVETLVWFCASPTRLSR